MVNRDERQAHQSQGIENGLLRLTATRSAGMDYQYYCRQSDNNSLHQPLWRNEIPRIEELSDEDVGMVSQDRDSDLDNVCSIVIQPSRRSIQETRRSTRMVDRQKFLPQARSKVGPSPRRSLCLSDQPPAAMIHDLEAHSRHHRIQCAAARLERSGQSLPLPSLESNPGNIAEDTSGKVAGYNSDTRLEVSSLVPNDSDDVSNLTNYDPSTSGPSSTWKRTRHSREEPSL
ncbi:hypothetical protein BGZ76_005129, partial [Entomortierella beljakovae]